AAARAPLLLCPGRAPALAARRGRPVSRSDSAAPKRQGLSDSQFALTIVGAVILFNVVVIILPLIYSLWITLHETNVILRQDSFVAGKHLAKLLADPNVVNAIGLSLKFTAISVVLSLLIGLGIALVLNESFPGRGVLRALVLLPWAVSEVVTATMWIFIVNPTFCGLTGIPPPLRLLTPP